MAAVLLVVATVLAAAFAIVSGSEHHAYAMGSAPPRAAQVTEQQQYELATPGGVSTALERGVTKLPGTDGGPARLALRCTWSENGSARQALPLVAAPVDTKAINVIATFTAPVTGRLRIHCAQLGAMYVAGADNGTGDPAGWFLVGSVIALTVGAGLGLSALRSALARRTSPVPEPS